MNTTQIRDRSDFAIVVPSFLDEYGLDPMEYRLYSHIVRRAGKDGCFESIPNMAKICLMNEKTVRKALRILIAAGLIKIIQERKGKTSIYEITHSSEWIDPQQLTVIRQQIITKKVEQNLGGSIDSGTKSGTTELGTSTKSGRGSGTKSGTTELGTSTKSGRGGGTKSGRGVVPNLVDEVFPIKEVPIKESQLREDPPTPQVEFNANDKISSPTSLTQHEAAKQPTSQQLTLLPIQPESSHQNDNPQGKSISIMLDTRIQKNLM
jgi:predicted transcriptional regulator